jgi:hypothetical protein
VAAAGRWMQQRESLGERIRAGVHAWCSLSLRQSCRCGVQMDAVVEQLECSNAESNTEVCLLAHYVFRYCFLTPSPSQIMMLMEWC